VAPFSCRRHETLRGVDGRVHGLDGSSAPQTFATLDRAVGAGGRIRGKHGRLTIAAILGVLAGAIVAALFVWPRSPAYENPVLQNDAPDPSILRADDGSFYAYTTQSYHEATFYNIPVLHSIDLVHWTLVGDAFRQRPTWTPPGVDNGDMWAPHIAHFGSTYYLYFSARYLKTAKMAIGVATADNPAGPFRDPLGEPLIVGDKGFDAIDPFVAQFDDTKYIYWGSDGVPIHVQELSEDGLSLIGKRQDVLSPSSRPYEGLIEGAWVLRHDAFFYLMYSGDACCGEEAHYAVMVARSSSPTGPFERDPDNPILQANDGYLAPGHNATVQDAAGNDWIVYHAMIAGDFTNYRYLFIDPIDWVDGWPIVNDGTGPSAESGSAPDV
jgi:arabinan endo-1,5-alpha-L-arabinosidase